AIRKLKSKQEELYLWQPSMQLGQPATILGYPVVDDDNMPDIGADEYPIAFGDFQRGYLIVDRMGIRILRDPFANKPYVHLYPRKRVGGRVHNVEAVKLWKAAASNLRAPAAARFPTLFKERSLRCGIFIPECRWLRPLLSLHMTTTTRPRPSICKA